MTPEDKAEKKQAPESFWITEFLNQFGVWQVFHAFRNKDKAVLDAGVKGRVIHLVEHSALVASQSEAEMWKGRCGKLVGTCESLIDGKDWNEYDDGGGEICRKAIEILNEARAALKLEGE